MGSSSQLSWLRAMPLVFVGNLEYRVYRGALWHAQFAPFLRFFGYVLLFLSCVFCLGFICPKCLGSNDKRQWLHLAVTGVFIQAGYLAGVWFCSQRWHGFWAFRLDRWIATGSHSHMVIVARRSRFSQAMARFGLGVCWAVHGGVSQIRGRQLKSRHLVLLWP